MLLLVHASMLAPGWWRQGQLLTCCGRLYLYRAPQERYKLIQKAVVDPRKLELRTILSGEWRYPYQYNKVGGSQGHLGGARQWLWVGGTEAHWCGSAHAAVGGGLHGMPTRWQHKPAGNGCWNPQLNCCCRTPAPAMAMPCATQ